MDNNLGKKYGLPTALAMVVGIVIGSGVFFKAEHVLGATGGDLSTGILAWILGGLVMIICAYVFSQISTVFHSNDGLLGYAESVVGSRYGYYVGWYIATIYAPALTSVLAWVSARYTCVLVGWSTSGGECMLLSGLYLILSYTLNVLAPKLAGHFQVSTTVIKLLPLVLMGIIGLAVGLASGTLASNFAWNPMRETVESPLFSAVVSTVFAYEGWIVATSINAELRDAERNMPIALVAGSVATVFIYIVYYIGLSGAVPNQVLMQNGEEGALIAYEAVFGRVGGVLFVFVIISCLGTLNGLMMGCVRILYMLSTRGYGPSPRLFSQVDPATQMPANSGAFALLMCGLWLTYYYGSNVRGGLFGPFVFDSSELPIVVLYLFYIPIYLSFMRRGKGLSPVKRYLIPALAVGCCLLILVAAYAAHGVAMVWFGLVALLSFLVGAFLDFRSRCRKH